MISMKSDLTGYIIMIQANDLYFLKNDKLIATLNIKDKTKKTLKKL